jgi:uncharacterized LabA/DUF88 family protein
LESGVKTALLIDGGYLRASAKKAAKTYDTAFIDKFSRICIDQSEYLFRVLYYDAPLYKGNVKLPVSGENKNFQSSDKWLVDISKLDKFAVRRGSLGFRGWKPKNTPIAANSITDADFSPIFEQKGVDMRIGLDIADFSERKSVDRLLIVSGDTDMVAALKRARKAGLEVGVIQMPMPVFILHDDILSHSDFVRQVTWP